MAWRCSAPHDRRCMRKRAMAVARKDDATAALGSVVTVPAGWEFIPRGDGTVLSDIPDKVASRFRLVYGYIGDAADEEKMFPNKLF